MYYIQSEVLLMVLTMVNLVDARAPYVCLSLGGILLILFCVQSVWEEKERFFNLLRFPLTIGFYVSGGCFFVGTFILSIPYMFQKLGAYHYAGDYVSDSGKLETYR